MCDSLPTDFVSGLVNLAIPFAPQNPDVDRLTALKAIVGDNTYMQRWQSTEDGEAEADFAEHGTKTALTKILSYHDPEVFQSKNGKTVLKTIELPDPLPSHLKDQDLQYFADKFNNTGFTGKFNFYRNMRRSWELMAPWANKGISNATLHVTGDQDLCLTMSSHTYINSPLYKLANPNLKDIVILPGVAHFLAEEAPELVNNQILMFFEEN